MSIGHISTEYQEYMYPFLNEYFLGILHKECDLNIHCRIFLLHQGIPEYFWHFNIHFRIFCLHLGIPVWLKSWRLHVHHPHLQHPFKKDITCGPCFFGFVTNAKEKVFLGRPLQSNRWLRARFEHAWKHKQSPQLWNNRVRKKIRLTEK